MLRKLAFAAVLAGFATSAIPAVNAPTGLSATALSTSTIQVTWTDNSSDESGFRIYMGNSSTGAFSIIGEVAANVTTFTASGIPASTQRFFRVQAFKHSVYVEEDISNLPLHTQATTQSSSPPNNAPVAVDDTNEGQAPITLSGNVLTNDTDADSDPLSVVQPNSNIAANGAYSIHFDEGGEFPFNYTVSDGRGGTDTGVLTITVDDPIPPNVPPVAVDDGPFTVQRDEVHVGNVIDNDSDSDGGTLTVQAITTGPFILETDGDYEFTPPVDPATGSVFGIDYVLEDGQGGSDVGRVTFDITEPPPPNLAPVAVDDVNSGVTEATITGNVLANDSDPEDDPMSVVQPAGIIEADGDYSFSSVDPGIFNQAYEVQDSNGNVSNEANLQITITEPPPPPAGLVTFPGAKGHGRFSPGGRGGAQIFVTNLNDSGAGSLRQCAEVASGPRTCIFRTSGIIDVLTSIKVQNPFVTIAGETAPNGITLRAGAGMCCDLMIVRTTDVYISHLKFRGGNPPHNVSSNGRNLMIGDILGSNPVHNVMVDHVSASWATDQPMDISPSNNPTGGSPVSRVTFQNMLVYEGLNPHSKGPNLRVCGSSFITSLIASNVIRNPNNTCGKYDPNNIRAGGGVTGENEFVNNVVYNGVEAFFDMWDGRGEAWVNIVGNHFIKGPQTKNKLNNNFAFNIYPVDAWHFTSRQFRSGTCAQNGGTAGTNCSADADALHMYLDDNMMTGFPTNPGGAPIHDVLNPNDAHLVEANPVGDGVFEDGLTHTPMAASAVRAYINANAGAFPQHRDSADLAILANLANGTGQIRVCNTVSTATTCNPLPYPTVAAGTPYTDNDNDGMEDAWETANGVTNPNGDVDSDGYTNLEEFLHQLAATR